MKEGDEVIYSIMIPAKGAAAHQHIVKALNEAGIGTSQIRVSEQSISVPRLYTRWRGDDDEQDWQRQLKNAIKEAIIDVKPWTYAPDYPIDTTQEIPK